MTVQVDQKRHVQHVCHKLRHAGICLAPLKVCEVVLYEAVAQGKRQTSKLGVKWMHQPQQ